MAFVWAKVLKTARGVPPDVLATFRAVQSVGSASLLELLGDRGASESTSSMPCRAWNKHELCPQPRLPASL